MNAREGLRACKSMIQKPYRVAGDYLFVVVALTLFEYLSKNGNITEAILPYVFAVPVVVLMELTFRFFAGSLYGYEDDSKIENFRVFFVIGVSIFVVLLIRPHFNL